MILTFIESITSAKAMITALGINAGVLLVLLIKAILNALQNQKFTKKINKILEESGVTLNEECKAKLSSIENKVDAKMDDIYNALCKKLKLDTQEKQEAVEKNSEMIKELIKSTKSEEITLDDSIEE